MKKSLVYSLTLLSMIGVCACQNDSEDLERLIPEKRMATFNNENYAPQILAKELAKIVQDENIREFIRNEANQQKDGDFDILFAEVLDKSITTTTLRSSGNTLRECLKNNNGITKSANYNVNIEELLNNIEKKHPLLQISIPNMETASWENIISNNAPFLVAYLSEDYDDMSGDPIPAYDQSGYIHMLDGEKAPQEPVIVISESERIFSVARSLKDEYKDYDIIYETPEYLYLKKEFIDSPSINNGKETSSNNHTLRATLSDRAANPNAWDYIWKAQIAGDDDYESWAKGRPEISVIISFWENKLPKKEIRYSDKPWANHNIRILNSEIIKWDPNVLGKYIAYSWREEDGGDNDKKVTIEIPSSEINGVKFPKSSYTFNIGNKDEQIGISYVNYDDKSGRQYDPTGIRNFLFWIQIR